MGSKSGAGLVGPSIAVFCSGNGSNFEALVKANRRGRFPGRIAVMVTDNPNAFAIERAKRLRIPVLFVDPSAFASKEEYEKALLKELRLWRVEWILLAGFMRILSPVFVRRYKRRILNIHPSLLPAFKGRSGIKDAFEYGVKVTGVTIHFVDEQVDHGPIVLQGCVKIREGEDLASLEQRIHKLEHRLYPEAVNLVLTRRWKIEKGRRWVLLS